MKLFGGLHLLLLGLIVGVTVLLCALLRRGRLPARAARLSLGCGLAVNELVWWGYRYSHEGVHAVNLPLQLCDLTLWLAVVARLTLAPAAVEAAYFIGLAGAGMALLTPDLWSPWPAYPAIYFFLAHGGIVVAAALPAFGGLVRFRPGAVWRSFGILAVYAVLVGIFNAAAGSNYMYLCRKPGNASLLDRMGPWPWYLASGGALGLALFWLLWLPVRPPRRGK
ncbi:MAG: TIGR02206 family membrane protein [Acidobacteria bacterium]|nr:TIGR02206 family membrane protein [Acidobacteriota bacterium]